MFEREEEHRREKEWQRLREKGGCRERKGGSESEKEGGLAAKRGMTPHRERRGYRKDIMAPTERRAVV